MTDIGLYLAANQNPIPQKASVPTTLGIKPGDFVAFRVLAVRPPPAGIFGMPEALLKPSLDMDESCWQVEKVLFRPKGYYPVLLWPCMAGARGAANVDPIPATRASKCFAWQDLLWAYQLRSLIANCGDNNRLPVQLTKLGHRRTQSKTARGAALLRLNPACTWSSRAAAAVRGKADEDASVLAALPRLAILNRYGFEVLENS